MASIMEFKNNDGEVVTGERELSALMMDEPGIICKHGCGYMACKGLVLSQIRGMLIITHGPVGCSYYSWGGNRLHNRDENEPNDYYYYSLSTAMDESDIIFGGEKKLKQAIKEAVEIFHPPVIAICTTCPIGLIGDDVDSIALEAQEEYGIQVMAFSCEGFRSVPGYRLANMGIIENVMGTGNKDVGKYPVNIIGEFYTGNRAKEISRIFKYIGYDIVCVLMGDGRFDDLKNAHKAKLNLFNSDKAVADFTEVLRGKFGTDWMKFNFIGLSNIINSLKNMAAFFNEPELLIRTNELINKEIQRISDEMNEYKGKLKDKIAVIFEDEFVSTHYRALLTDLEVNPIMVGNDLICQSGQNEISFLSSMESGKGTSDERNEVQYNTDLNHYHIDLPIKIYEKIKSVINETGFSNINGSIRISHLNHDETEHILCAISPDIYFPRIKENFAGVGSDSRSCFFNADDYRFDYGGFNGAMQFAEDLLMNIKISVWQKDIAPWSKEVIECLI